MTSYEQTVKRKEPSRLRMFGSWIREQRESRHLSQSGAAQRAGIDRQQWYRIEGGLSGTKRETVIAMANAVSADVNEALHRAGYSGLDFQGENTDPEGIYAHLNKLDPDTQKLAKRQIKALMDTFIEEENPDTDYIDDEENK